MPGPPGLSPVATAHGLRAGEGLVEADEAPGPRLRRAGRGALSRVDEQHTGRGVEAAAAEGVAGVAGIAAGAADGVAAVAAAVAGAAAVSVAAIAADGAAALAPAPVRNRRRPDWCSRSG